MKKFAFCLALTMVVPSAIAQVQTQTPFIPPVAETISVTGTGKTNVAPDRFTFTAGVQTVAQTVEELVSILAAKYHDVSANQIRADVEQFISELLANGLVTHVEPRAQRDRPVP